MACFGSKALQSRRPKTHNLVYSSDTAGEDHLSKQGRKKKSKNRRLGKRRCAFSEDQPAENPPGKLPDKIVKAQTSLKHQSASMAQKMILRKQVDPETAKYFSEIANLFEGTGVDLEERSVICCNALEETRGKELEIATDYIISHTLQTLLEGCELYQLCGFLESCANEFPFIAMDKSGSHVAETALRSLGVVVLNPVKIMCSPYGSHVLRSLLCLCKGVPLDSSREFHVRKSSNILAERLNLRATCLVGDKPPDLQKGFPDLLKYLVSEMLKCAREDIRILQVDQYSSFVLQTALKLLTGEDQELMHVIPVLLGCPEKTFMEGDTIESTVVKDILALLKDTAYSHLMEVILEVAPNTLFNEILTKIFKNSLYEVSCHHCGSFVVQALISSTRCRGQMELIWDEIGPKFKELLEMGRSGVIASLLAASQRLHTFEDQCCEALAAAVCSENESSRCIVPRILFLDGYFSCEDKSNWSWPKADKMHVLGCLILQTVFRYPSELIQPYVISIISMEADHVLEVAKDAGGGRVLESFLGSDASAKHKRKLLVKLKGQFRELSMHPSGSFIVEKCFTTSNVSLKETIASELLAVRVQLSKTKQGPHLLRKLDIDGFATRPDQWRLRQASKQTAYKEFYAEFGSDKTGSPVNSSFLAQSILHPVQPKGLKKMRKEIDQSLVSVSTSSLGFSAVKQHEQKAKQGNKKISQHDLVDALRDGNKYKTKKRKSVEAENAVHSCNSTANVGDVQRLPQSLNRKDNKRHQQDSQSKISVKKSKR
ncbi:PREDICTED: pumilio homolog 23 isoform X2 [Nelumbo nucifera]|uniref:Pumilio homolog 23 isoform X2 n=1 Tax=Nelumbo nucifera TaxID=4432 RepID=A0A1U8ASW5_NELNU|nr:PREDICTED: pumilio homolog 23 isoform X2 [Nelumbo nucifera]